MVAVCGPHAATGPTPKSRVPGPPNAGQQLAESLLGNPRRYCSWVCLSVCVSVKSHLTYGASVRHENAVTYSAASGQRRSKKVWGFL